MASFNRKIFLNALKTVGAVIPSRTTQPVLESVLLRCRDSVATLTATDNECRVSVSVESDAGLQSEHLLPYLQVSGLLAAMSGESFTLAGEDGMVVLTDSTGVYTVLTPNVAEFPSETFPIELTFPTDSMLLSRSLPMVTSVVSETGGGSDYIEGVRFDCVDNAVYLVGTDKGRLCSCRIGSGTLEPFTLSLKVSNLVSKMQGKISIGCQRGVASFVSDGMSITTRTVQGAFPQWVFLVDGLAGLRKLDVKLSELLEGLRKTAVFTNPESRGVSVKAGPDTTVIASQGADKGRCNIKLHGGSDTSADFKLNGEKLAAFLAKVPQQLPSTFLVGDKFAVTIADYGYFFMGLMEQE